MFLDSFVCLAKLLASGCEKVITAIRSRIRTVEETFLKKYAIANDCFLTAVKSSYVVPSRKKNHHCLFAPIFIH